MKNPSLNARILDQHILVVLDEFKLYLMDHDAVLKSFPVSIGKPKAKTPIGVFIVLDMTDNPARSYDFTNCPKEWTPEIYGSHCIDLSCYVYHYEYGIYRGYAIHGTNEPWNIGRAVSHGCVRMKNEDVEQVYEFARKGMLVMINDYPTA